MALDPGGMLSHYRLVEKIGEGGMGVVWSADDTVLGRQVAIKVLPDDFAQDQERLARFKQEARLLAALNHPNIAGIHGLEESDGVRYLVLELVPGLTLAERIGRGPLPMDEALTVCRQIAEALEAAHEKGIIHRDLKPGNVKVTPDGKVKVLDFGLAKAFEADAMSGDLSHSPTLTSPPTKAGVLLGTASYMSPEQARGKPLDKRTDIWSFGCVLYELLTGKKAFGGETVSDTIGAIMRGEPDWRVLPEMAPASARRLLRRCLEKDSKLRLHDIADVRIEIHEALSEPSASVGEAVGVPQSQRWRGVLPWTIATLMTVIAGVAVWSLWRATASPSKPVAHLAIPLPPGETLALDTRRSGVALSPDGSRLVYVASHGGKRQLYLREMDQARAAPIPGTEGASGPFFSPDGKSVGFIVKFILKRVSLSGGSPVTLGVVPPIKGASWGPDESIIFTRGPNDGLVRVSADQAFPSETFAGSPSERAEIGDELERLGVDLNLTTPDPTKGEYSHRWPEILPGGQSVLITIDTGGSFDDARIAALSLKTGKIKILSPGGTNARYAPSGHLVFARAGALLAAPFDPATLEVTGEPITVIEGVMMEPGGAAHFSLSKEGTLVYVPGSMWVSNHKLVWVNRKGEVEPLPMPSREFNVPRLSPDGRWLAMDITKGSNSDIWVSELERGTLIPLTFHPNEDFGPIWMPDGKRLAFSSEMGGTGPDLFMVSADGSGVPQPLLTSAEPRWRMANSWSPDGKLLAFVEYRPTTGTDIWVLSVEGEGKASLFLGTEFQEVSPMFSPDGRWLAYVSDESGNDEVYVQAYFEPGRKWLISIGGGIEPVWAPSGREIFYRNGDKMMAVAVITSPTFIPSTPRRLFEGEYAQAVGTDDDGIWPNYDVTRDGERFVMIKTDQKAPTQIRVVLNWFEELKRLVPTESN